MRGELESCMPEILNFTDLEFWKVGRRIRRRIYQITSTFPPTERYNLTRQMRSAAVLIYLSV